MDTDDFFLRRMFPLIIADQFVDVYFVVGAGCGLNCVLV